MNDKPFIVMYHGAVDAGRGIEQLIEVVAANDSIYGVILGNGDSKYVTELKRMADTLKVSERILFHEAVAQCDLWKYIGAADVELVLIQNVSRSYYLSLPNKFFESIQSLTPMVTSNFPEMSRLINEYGIGLTCPPDDVAKINTCIEMLRRNSAMYDALKMKLVVAKERFTWENESRTLFQAYGNLMKWSKNVQAIKLLWGDYKFASRDQREVAVMKELGWHVNLAFPATYYSSCEFDDVIDIKRYRILPNQNTLLRKWLIIKNEMHTILQIRKLNADVISCHDLTMLRYAWIAFIGKKRPKLIYDSHEFEIGRYTEGHRSSFTTKVITHIEGFLMKRIPLSLMVNESIAHEVAVIHGLKVEPLTVRNVPNIYILDQPSINGIRREYLEYFEKR